MVLTHPTVSFLRASPRMQGQSPVTSQPIINHQLTVGWWCLNANRIISATECRQLLASWYSKYFEYFEVVEKLLRSTSSTSKWVLRSLDSPIFVAITTMSNRRATKRRRHQHSHASYGFHASSAATSNEERLLHQTIQNSKLGDTRGTRGVLGNKMEVPWGPVFFPTVADMEGSPLDYIDKIRPVAQRYGICKIVPPEGWKQRDFFGE
jgi:jmjN domain